MNAYQGTFVRWCLTAMVGALALMLVAWGATQTHAQEEEAEQTTVRIAEVEGLGLILTSADGMTLYTFDRDTLGVSNCTGGCVANWPLLLLEEGDPVAPPDLPGVLGVIVRADGARQVTYNDLPLYFYVRDQNPGDTTGDGVGGIWHVARP